MFLPHFLQTPNVLIQQRSPMVFRILQKDQHPGYEGLLPKMLSFGNKHIFI